jgi:pyruvate dehydrogenase E1 component alpha subunit
MPGVRVDGNDPLAVAAAVTDALDRARRGDGPTFVECVTFRFRGHYFGDPMAYIPEDQMAAATDADPVPRFRAHLVESGICSDAELDAIEANAVETVDEAVAAVMAAPAPGPDELDRDVFASPLKSPA